MKKITNFAAILMMSTMLQSQTTIFVTPNGTGDGTSWTNACNLEEAIAVIERSRNAASLNDRMQIWVQKGTYYPSKMLIIPASVKIYGGFAGTETALSQRNFSANLTIIDGQEKIGSIFRLENSAEINGFTIQHGNANGNPQKNGGGVWADENCVIENCKIINNVASLNGGGIYANGKVKIINSTIDDNTANGSGNDMFGNCMKVVAHQEIATGVTIAGCNPHILDFGEVSFKTQTTVPVTADGVTLTWSDAVIAEGCNKTSYYGGISGSYYSDCRTNSDRSLYGDLFSWCAIARFAHVLCPAPWRVPTKDDFVNLDKTLGGTGENRSGASAMLPQYIGTGANQWGGVFGGACRSDGTLYDQGWRAYYWSQTEHNADSSGFNQDVISNGSINPQDYSLKLLGFTLRCVR